MADAETMGVLIETVNRYGTEYVCVRVMRREADAKHPLNLSYGSFQPFGDFTELALEGFVSDFGDRTFTAFEPAYQNPHHVQLGQAEAMVRVLRKISATFTKEISYTREPGDVFAAFCKAIGAKWAVHCLTSPLRGSLAENEWRWMTIVEGRGYLRTAIKEAEARAQERAA